MYTTTITQSGQITLNKAAREKLGVKNGDKVVVDFEKGKLVVEPRLSDEDFLKALDDLKSKESLEREKEIGQKYADKSVREMIEDFENSDAGKRYIEEEHAL